MLLSKRNRLGRIAMIIVGSLFLLIGGVWSVTTALFVANAERVPGEIVRLEGPGSYRPYFAYRLPTGERVEQSPPGASDLYRFKIGQQVTIVYDRRDPRRSNILSFETLWLGPIAFAGMGVLVSVLAFVIPPLREMLDRKMRGIA